MLFLDSADLCTSVRLGVVFGNESLFNGLGLAPKHEEALRVAHGFPSPREWTSLSEEARAERRVKVEIEVVPHELTVDALCMLQCAKDKDNPDFLDRVGREIVMWDQTSGVFAAPWLAVAESTIGNT